ncbi:hypothetical protein, variant [Aphanomyces astaci]|uniref:Phospholipase/carboxylesterase/thioesterase domain-containing protein n=1 Tax=Aphanomyces astaci TaxID=112090 RepID=W4FX17_APHAT|nr:hypothetical protein, variant [Aphanomyces astaci]ETV71496.1 hypothetical protein, variant [Aphanomyces astaci]|eukprot:XP_009839160.1 hypothetical protein, variant [Aphanomyces astaci]
MARRLAVGDEVELLRVRGKVLKVLPESGVALLHIHATSTTRWAFLHELAPVSASTSWAPTSFPSMLQHWQVHSCPTSNENLLLFLHGLGDTHESLFTLGQAMQLPQTAFASFRAPHALPFDLGYHWFDHALDAQGDVLPHHVPDPRRLQRYYQYHHNPFTSVAAWTKWSPRGWMLCTRCKLTTTGLSIECSSWDLAMAAPSRCMWWLHVPIASEAS